MSAYEEIWDVAEDNHGVITTSMARKVGVKASALVSMATNRKLIRLGHGVYKLNLHVPGPYDEYAQAVAFVGESGFIRGASALMMRGLIPHDPRLFRLGVSRRLRRNLPERFEVKMVARPDIEMIEGIPVERIPSAIADARMSGDVDVDRLKELENSL